MNKKFFLVTTLALLTLVGAGCTQSISLNSSSFGNTSKNVGSNNENVLGTGSQVFAEWTDKTWYHGAIGSTCDKGFDVTFDDGNQKCVTTDQLFFDKTPEASLIKVGSKVIAKWTAIAYYDAEVIKITEDKYTVKYYDKMERDVVLSELVLDTRKDVRGDENKIGQELKDGFKSGDSIIAEWVTPNGLYMATVIGVCDKGLNVKYYDDAEKCLATSQMILDVPANKNNLQVGTSVLVRDSNTKNFLVGKITKLVADEYEVNYNAFGNDVTKVLGIEQLRLDIRK